LKSELDEMAEVQEAETTILLKVEVYV